MKAAHGKVTHYAENSIHSFCGVHNFQKKTKAPLLDKQKKIHRNLRNHFRNTYTARNQKPCASTRTGSNSHGL